MSDTTIGAPSAPAKEAHGDLSIGQMIAYGTGGVVSIALFNIAGQLIGLIGNISLGLSAFWLGVIMILPRLWDAVSDPLFGNWSDRTRSRHGRRRPFLLAGGIAVAVSFVLMWWVPQGGAVRAAFPSAEAFEWFQLGYILLTLLLFYTAVTAFEIPHGALGMEMTKEPDGSTRLFSAKSFFGNVFAMATPWLFVLANMEVFRGETGNEAHGMRYVSLIVAAVLIPASIAWFMSVREPVRGVTAGDDENQPSLFAGLKITFANRSFIKLVAIVFILALGFNVVGLLAYYIPIYYVFAGDKAAAAPLLGLNGTLWALTAIIAVVPLNIISERLGKLRALQLAILLMAAAQIAKIVCYNPDHPYLLLVPTVLLSAGMLFFFTLGPSILRDICDEDREETGRRIQGTYYSVYWWFIKIGMAFAGFATGLLITVSQFDEKQATGADRVVAAVRTIEVRQTAWVALDEPSAAARIAQTSVDAASEAAERFARPVPEIDEAVAEVRAVLSAPGPAVGRVREEVLDLDAAVAIAEVRRFRDVIEARGNRLSDHDQALTAAADRAIGELETLTDQGTAEANTDQVRAVLADLIRQSPRTLLWLRVLEIGLPFLLCLLSLYMSVGFEPTASKRRSA